MKEYIFRVVKWKENDLGINFTSWILPRLNRWRINK